MNQPRPPRRRRTVRRPLALLRLAAALAAALVPVAATFHATPAHAEAPATRPAATTRPAVDEAVKLPLAEALDRTLGARAGTGATYVARVVDLSTGRELYAHRPDAPAIPASNMKLLVTAAALGTWGAEHTFDTHFALSGDDLVIVGTGDPALGDPTLAAEAGGHPTDPLDRVADALAERGITTIVGDVVYYQNAFDDARVHPSWDADDLVHWYAAPVSGLAMNDNCIDVTVHPTEPGRPVRAETVPPIQNYALVNAMVTAGDANDSGPADGVPATAPASKPADDESPDIAKRPGEMTYVLTGALEEETELKSKPVDDPGAFLADALRTRLAARGIAVAGTLRESPGVPDGFDPATLAPLPGGPDDLYTHRSTMADVLRRVNTNSQNLFAEMLCKGLGRAAMVADGKSGDDARGSWAGGEDAVRRYLDDHGVDVSDVSVADGSGLSRGNKVTARAVTDVLALTHASPDAAVWRQSLTVAGETGTIGRRMKDVAGRVIGKTGYIGGVRSLSGYALRDDGRPVAFCFIYNGIKGSVGPYEELQDDACRILLRHDLPSE